MYICKIVDKQIVYPTCTVKRFGIYLQMGCLPGIKQSIIVEARCDKYYIFLNFHVYNVNLISRTKFYMLPKKALKVVENPKCRVFGRC